MPADETMERFVRDALAPEPTATERDAVWRSIETRLDEQEAPVPAPAPVRTPRRRPRFAMPRLAVAGMAAGATACALAGVALLPAGDRAGTPLLAEASAAEVLKATARSAAALPAVGGGQVLYARVAAIPPGGTLERASLTETWTAPDGSGRVLEAVRGGRVTGETTYRAGDERGRRADGTRLEAEDGWRAVVGGAGVAELPGDADALLADLRERVAARAATGGLDDLGEIDRYGRDLLVAATAVGLLVEAPLSPGQREAAFALLAGAEGWYEPGATATPPRIERAGTDRDALGREGTVVRVVLTLTPAEAGAARGDREAVEWALDLVLDPDRGRLLEVREREEGPGSPAWVRVTEAQRVVDAPR